MLISLKVEHGRAVRRPAGDRRGRGARVRRRRPRLAPARGPGAAHPGDRTAHPADRPVGHGRQPGRAAGLAAGIGARAASRPSWSPLASAPAPGCERRVAARGCRAGLRGVGEQRRDGDRVAAPGRETAGVLRLPAAGRGDRRRAARAGGHHVPVARVPAARRAAPGRAGVRRGAGLRDRGHLHAGARHRRGRPGPGHPGQRPADASPRSCSGSGGPAGGRAAAGTACSSP